MANEPLITVVMCTYNGAKYLDEQVQSIVEQDYTNFGFIVVDDCSTDNTWEMLQGWQQKFPFIQLHRNGQNLGYNKNFENAMGMAKGDFIALSDQDDIWLPGKLTALLKGFTAEDIVLVHSRSVPLENGELKHHHVKLSHHFEGDDTRRLFLYNQLMGHDAMFRTSLLQYILPIPTNMSYDWWISVTATCYGKIGAVNKVLVYHRKHESNSFFNKNAPSKKKELDLAETLELFAAIPGMKPAYKTFLLNFIKEVRANDAREKDGFNPRFFTFLHANRQLFFGHKRRLLPAIAYFKAAVKLSKIKFKNRGII